MEHGQFYHYETYGRKTSEAKNKKGSSLYTVLGEAFREPEYSSHVNPYDTENFPPEIVFGMEFDKNMTIAEKLEAQKDRLIALAEAYAKAKGLKGKDGCILAGIVSYPPGTTREVLLDIRERFVLPFLKKKWRRNLRCVLGHSDEYFWDDEGKRREPHYQDHWYVILDAKSNIRLTSLHAGIAAKRNAIAGEAGKDGKKHSDKAYRDAMRKEQDEFFTEVGNPAGWARTTNRGIRYSREQVKVWKQNQQEMKKQQEAVKQNIEHQNEAVKAEGERIIKDANAKAEGIKTEANTKAKKIISDAKNEAQQIKQEILQRTTTSATHIVKTAEETRKNILTETAKDQENILSVLKADLTKTDVPQPQKGESAPTFFERISGWLKGLILNIKTREKALGEKEKALDEKKKTVDIQLSRLVGNYGEENQIKTAIGLLQGKLKTLQESKTNKKAEEQEKTQGKENTGHK